MLVLRAKLNVRSPQPEQAPCFGDKDPLNMAPAKRSLHRKKSVFILEKSYYHLQRSFLRLTVPI